MSNESTLTSPVPLRSARLPEAETRYDVKHIGRRLRELRVANNLTVNRLAQNARVPASTVSKIENGLLRPSLVHAINLATALGENLGFLVDAYRGTPQDRVIVRADDREQIAYPELGMRLQDMNGNFHSGVLEARVGKLQPLCNSGGEMMTHLGEEFCYVLRGTLRYFFETNIYDLVAGDSIHFKSTLKHRWENIGNEPVDVLWVFSDGLSF